MKDRKERRTGYVHPPEGTVRSMREVGDRRDKPVDMASTPAWLTNATDLATKVMTGHVFKDSVEMYDAVQKLATALLVRTAKIEDARENSSLEQTASGIRLIVPYRFMKD